MSEEDEKWEIEQNKKQPIIIWADGIPCIDLPPGSIMKKGQKKSVEIPHFRFGRLQDKKEREYMNEMVKELDKIFNSNMNTPFFPANWKIYEIDQWGGVKEIKKEDEKDDNAK